MANPEQETIIVMNDGDREEGFFCFGTSRADHYRKMLRRIGGEERLLDLKISMDEKGNPVWWQARLPISFLSKAHFGLRARIGRGE